MSPPVKIVFGTGSVGDRITGASTQEALDLLHKHGHVEIDTAAVYPNNQPGASESEIGKVHPDWARVSTKVMAGVERSNSRGKMQQSLEGSLEKLNGLDLDIFYYHVPEAATPMEEQAAAMDEAHKAGKFKRFGISNFSPEQVEELAEIAERKGECGFFALPLLRLVLLVLQLDRTLTFGQAMSGQACSRDNTTCWPGRVRTICCLFCANMGLRITPTREQ